jgi:probable F420-dependent oxidoreductase
MLKIGAVYPQVELDGDPAALDSFARTIEEMGFDHMLIYDHVIGAQPGFERDPPLWEHGPYNSTHPFHEPMTALAYIAGITRRLDLITGILILPQRQTILVAKQATEIDLLSGGRLHLGVGTGWNYVEYDALGYDFHTRGKRMDEQIPFLRQLWDEATPTFKGRFDSVDRGGINPRPRRQIPIYCGGFSEPAYARAARLADGFIFAADIDGALAGWARTRELLAEQGRDASNFRAQYMVQQFGGDGITLDATIDGLRRWEDSGAHAASIVTMGLGFTELAQHIDYLEEVRNRVGVNA